MIVNNIINILEEWAPPGSAWEKDNVGLQIGNTKHDVRRILLALDCTEAIADEAVKNNIDLIITHHPLFFRSIKNITDGSRRGRITQKLIKSDIRLYAIHTNADFIRDGVSLSLANTLGLQETSILAPLSDQTIKIVSFVPPESIEKVTEAMSHAGAGVIGNYSECSFRVEGTGAYRPGKGSKPYIGKQGDLETVKEIRLEMIAPRWSMQAIIKALIASHPYEEVAYDIYPTENTNPNFGAGLIGTLRKPMPLKQFLKIVKKNIAPDGFRYTTGKMSDINRIAVCGGNGNEYINSAITAGADAYITADITYHTFQDAEGALTLIDAGHFETERFILFRIEQILKEYFNDKKTFAVIHSKTRVNSIHYF